MDEVMDDQTNFSHEQRKELLVLLDAHRLNEQQIDEIASKAADKAVKQMTDEAYRLVGKTVVEKVFWVVGLIVVAAASWMAGKGLLK